MSLFYQNNKTGDPEPEEDNKPDTLSSGLKKAPKIIDNNCQIQIMMGDSEETTSESPIFSISRLKN